MAAMNGAAAIAMDQGWEQEIKPKAIDKLCSILNEGLNDRRQTDLFGPKDYVHIYTVCYSMCTQRNPFNWSENLYQKHNETIRDYLLETVLPSLRAHHNEYLLQEMQRRWENHKIMNNWMRKFFMYLDRYYVKHNNLPSLHVSGNKLFKEQCYDVVKKDVVSAMLAMIDAEREGNQIDRSLIKSCVELIENMGDNKDCYEQDFEAALLSGTREFYARKSQQWLAGDGTPDYLVKAEAALEQEKARVSNYLLSSSEDRTLAAVVDELLTKHEATLIDREGSGCAWLLANDKLEDLSRMFRLFSRVPEGAGLPPIAELVERHMTTMGEEIVAQRQARVEAEGDKESNADATLVKAFLSLHDKCVALVDNQFEKHSLFHKALSSAFKAVVNKSVGRYTNAEHMASFCDRMLKKGGEKLSETEVEEGLEKVASLFEYLYDKDLFAEIYRNYLGKRLLNQRSSSEEWEKSMIGKLKQRQGSQFTSKLEGMMNDLSLGSDHQKAFTAHMKGKNVDLGGRMATEDFTVKVLTGGYWPSYRNYESLQLPQVMVRCQQLFTLWYHEKNQGRRLAWQHGLGGAVIRARFGPRTYDLQVNTLQAVVLMAFQTDTEVLGFRELQSRIGGIPSNDMRPLLHSLSCARIRVLKKTPMNDKPREDDTFTPNEKFTSQQRVVRIAMASVEESHNPKRVEEDRGFAIEAAIVRIMKARKVLDHQSLISEVLNQLIVFRPDPKVVKQRVHALIEREYLERDAEAPNTYRYLA